MNWQNLKVNKCPSCNKKFGYSSFTKTKGYIICDCGFSIREKRYSEIVNSQVTKELPSMQDDEDERTTEEDFL